MLIVHTTNQITEYEVLFKKDEKRQKLVAYAKRLRTCRGCVERKQQIHKFKRNEKAFYQ